MSFNLPRYSLPFRLKMCGSSGKMIISSSGKSCLEMVILPLVNWILIGTSIWSKRALVICICGSGSSLVTVNGEGVFSVQAVTLSWSKTLTQNCGSISIWGVGVVICRGLQPLRITSDSKRITAFPFEIRKCRPAETFRETFSMEFAVNWMVDNINFPDNLPVPVLRHAAKIINRKYWYPQQAGASFKAIDRPFTLSRGGSRTAPT